MPAAYDCAKCPGFCCSYPAIPVTRRDVARLARHFGITEAEAEAKFCRRAHGYKRILGRKKDGHFGRICRFFDTRLRRCTVYHARPATCRAYPAAKRCGYWDFLSFERGHQGDAEHIAKTDSREWR